MKVIFCFVHNNEPLRGWRAENKMLFAVSRNRLHLFLNCVRISANTQGQITQSSTQLLTPWGCVSCWVTLKSSSTQSPVRASPIPLEMYLYKAFMGFSV